MPDRIVRAGILTSDAVNKLSAGAEVFYRRLMNVADDHGRYDGRTEILRAVLFPLRLERVSSSDIGKWILETGEAGLVRQYHVEQKPYLEIVKFGQKIRSKSKWPDPPAIADTCQQMPADVPVVVVVGECVGEDSVEPSKGSPPVIALPLADGTEFEIAEGMVGEWKSAFPAVDVLQELREMRAWCLANPAQRKTRRGASAFVVRWLSKEQDRGGKGERKGVSLPSYT